jgi:Rrf2 family protein
MIISEISQEGNLPQKFLESILQELRRGGVLQSRKGRHGGYSLTRSPRAISLGEILRLTGSMRLETENSHRDADPGHPVTGVDEVNVSALLSGVRGNLMKVLDDTSLQDMLDKWESRRQPSDVDWVI